MRALGIDVGSRRIGTALSDQLGLLAAPWRAVQVARGRELAELAAMVAEREIEIIVIGLPVSLDGTEGPQAATVRAFAARLAAYLAQEQPNKDAPPMPIEFTDERFTTAEAERLLMQRNLSREQRKARIDAAAAAIMLQDWLDARRPRQPLARHDDE